MGCNGVVGGGWGFSRVLGVRTESRGSDSVLSRHRVPVGPKFRTEPVKEV